MFCLMVVYWNERWRAGSRWSNLFWPSAWRWAFLPSPSCIKAISSAKSPARLLPGEKDPSRRVRAWKPTAALVEAAREKLAAEGKPAFIIADHYGMTGLYFVLPAAGRAALKSEPLVYCVDSDEPENQFYFWPEYNYRAQRKGQNAIYVTEA